MSERIPAGEPWSLREEIKLISALKTIPADIGGQEWASIGMAMADVPGTVINGVDHYLEIFDRWSSTSLKEKPDLGAYEGREKIERRWQGWRQNPKDPNVVPVTVASIYHRARSLGWADPDSVISNVNGIESAGQVLPTALATKPIKFVDFTEKGIIAKTATNTRIALQYLKITCRYDLFHNRQYVDGQVIERWAGEIADDTILAIRSKIRSHWRLDPPTQTTIDAVVMECLEHAYDPVLDYLDSLQWDGRPRLATWMTDYLGAEDTPLNRMVAGLSLVAAVRRARVPGCKFDHVIVLEGLEGMGKSSAVSILAGAENFSDQEILTLDDKGQQEQVQGVWLYEIAELAGMRRAEVERVKAFVTRTVDRARPAYGRRRVDRGRRCVFFASCNNEYYLLSQTGNRRFWPVKCKWVLMEGLKDARDQLWAEASMLEAKGVSLALPAAFWPIAADVQESRRVRDPWEEILRGIEYRHHKIIQSHENEYRIATTDLMDTILTIPTAQQTTPHYHRIGTIMRMLGWDGPKTLRLKLIDNSDETITKKGFSKPL